jgi:hypothetical protein
MNSHCRHCSALLIERGLRPSLGVQWLCARCGAAGRYVPGKIGRREVTVREQTVPGAPELRRPWVPAESMPYAERVRPIGGAR